MKQLESIDLNAICRIIDWVAVISLVLGIIGSYVLAQEEHAYRTSTNMGVLLIGLVVTFLDFVFLLFLSRVGDAIDDIRNHHLYSISEEQEK